MKKSLYFACFCIFAFLMPVFAMPLCAKPEIVTIVLDPDIAGQSSAYNTELSTWSVNFSYGTISGISTCQSVKGSSQGSVEISANGGENMGASCWCKMKHPMNSLWTFTYTFGSSPCADNCSQRCANDVSRNSQLRNGLFGSVQQ